MSGALNIVIHGGKYTTIAGIWFDHDDHAVVEFCYYARSAFDAVTCAPDWERISGLMRAVSLALRRLAPRPYNVIVRRPPTHCNPLYVRCNSWMEGCAVGAVLAACSDRGTQVTLRYVDGAYVADPKITVVGARGRSVADTPAAICAATARAATTQIRVVRCAPVLVDVSEVAL